MYNENMKIFSGKNPELKDFEEIILDIEKERDTISWCHATIQNCLWNLENPKVERWVIDWCVRDLRENLNKNLSLFRSTLVQLS